MRDHQASVGAFSSSRVSHRAVRGAGFIFLAALMSLTSLPRVAAMPEVVEPPDIAFDLMQLQGMGIPANASSHPEKLNLTIEGTVIGQNTVLGLGTTGQYLAAPTSAPEPLPQRGGNGLRSVAQAFAHALNRSRPGEPRRTEAAASEDDGNGAAGATLLFSVLEELIDPGLSEEIAQNLIPLIDTAAMARDTLQGLGNFVLVYVRGSSSIDIVDFRSRDSIRIVDDRLERVFGQAVNFRRGERASAAPPQNSGSSRSIIVFIRKVRENLVAFVSNPITIVVVMLGVLAMLMRRMARDRT